MDEALRKHALSTYTKSEVLDNVRGAILGHAVGDALGVPVEFTKRDCLQGNPVSGMRGYGTHNQPAGTWSDDTSLSLCLASSLCNGYDLNDQARLFVNWLYDGEWAPHGEVFDVGCTTREAISSLANGCNPIHAGPKHEHSNGNGSLMRVLPLALYCAAANPEKRIEMAMQASCLTHGHLRSQLACAFYVDLAARLIGGETYPHALAETQQLLGNLIEDQYFKERASFNMVLDPDLASREEENISGDGYVMHTLSASLWCCLRADSYEQAVLLAVNLGEDTDTTGAVTGGLAGLIYGSSGIPAIWANQLARIEDIENLCRRISDSCMHNWKGLS